MIFFAKITNIFILFEKCDCEMKTKAFSRKIPFSKLIKNGLFTENSIQFLEEEFNFDSFNIMKYINFISCWFRGPFVKLICLVHNCLLFECEFTVHGLGILSPLLKCLLSFI